MEESEPVTVRDTELDSVTVSVLDAVIVVVTVTLSLVDVVAVSVAVALTVGVGLVVAHRNGSCSATHCVNPPADTANAPLSPHSDPPYQVGAATGTP